MKKFILIMIALTLAHLGMAATTGSDVASNYSSATWTNNSNQGTGFEPWQLWAVPPGGRFIWTSTQYGAGNVDTAGLSFGLWANPAQVTNISYARRFFAGGPLETLQQFSVDIAPSTQAGTRGVSILGPQTNVLITFNAGSGGYTLGGTPLGWSYSQSSVFNLTALQTDTQTVAITLTRGSQTYQTNITGAVAGFVAFNGNNPTGGANNFYFNKLAITVIPEPGTLILLGLGIGGALILRRRWR